MSSGRERNPEARTKMKLRRVPLLLVREMARLKTHRHLMAQTLGQVIQRADERTEFVAIYWKDGKTSLSGQVKKGLAKAFQEFDEYQLAKYDRKGPIRLRDVLFRCHAKPRDPEQATLWKRKSLSSCILSAAIRLNTLLRIRSCVCIASKQQS
jgi:60 kDa SS-A/Ro ribonucleoprotein